MVALTIEGTNDAPVGTDDAATTGEFNVLDPKMTAIALLDMLNGINNWFREGGRLRVGQVADHYAVLSLQLVGSAEALRGAMRTVA